MNHLKLILPFGIPPASIAKDLARQLKMPNLARILSLAKPSTIHQFEEYARLLPHESLLAGQFHLENGKNNAPSFIDGRFNSPSITHHRMQEMGMLPQQGVWFTINPVRIHVAHNHLVLMDQRRLNISKEESRALFEAAKAICDEDGYTLMYGDEKTWFLRADKWCDIQTATLDAASGHNMDIWIAKGEHAKAWRKLQNEIQMLWHISPINQQREEQGEPAINSVWLHCASEQLNEQILKKMSGESALHNLIENPSHAHYLMLDDLSEAAINNDWNAWFSQMQKLEEQYFTPIAQAYQTKKITHFSFIASDANRLITMSLNPKSSWQFWKKPSLQPLFELA
jgi:hypothetical protein